MRIYHSDCPLVTELSTPTQKLNLSWQLSIGASTSLPGPLRDPETCLELSKQVYPDHVFNNTKSFSKTTRGYVKTHTMK